MSEEYRDVSRSPTAAHILTDDLDLWVLGLELLDPIADQCAFSTSSVAIDNHDWLVAGFHSFPTNQQIIWILFFTYTMISITFYVFYKS